ncbi:FxsA family membrane protein [Streptantibioticus ferralitis]|uniref:FxsA family protein n=1 Tax=Streptantibioticus ferralitis TaxID=236510 RepID=A0ABT5YT19_9ACTN|nr:FxsA family membrane protein [Streptantibioticus ferralitis]MDF2254756.1 FxsA family protein [Streptantibioticus ferralitis]
MTFGAPDPSRPPQPARSRVRTIALLGVAVWAVLEIWLLTVVAGAIGGGMVLLLLLAGFLVGGYAVKRAGRRAWQSLTASFQAGGPASSADGAGTEMLGGLLIMVPGFISDAAGLLCLFPPTRKALGAAAVRLLGRSGRPAPGSFGETFQQARSAGEQMRMRWPDGKVVQGEVIRDGAQDGGSPDSGPRGPQDAPRPPLAP